MLKKLIISTIATGAIAVSATIGATTEASAATQNYSATKYVKSYDGSLNVRSTASVKGKLVGTVKNGAKVKITSKKTVSGRTWVKGTVSGKTGWMNASYLSSTKVKKASASTSNSSLISFGAKYRGVPYVWGGTTPSGFDCSGFTSYVYKHVTGKTLPRTSGAQYASAKKISRSQLQAGDLVFFSASGGRITHVALYAGNGQLLHAAGNKVQYQSLAGYWAPLVVGYGRY